MLLLLVYVSRRIVEMYFQDLMLVQGRDNGFRATCFDDAFAERSRSPFQVAGQSGGTPDVDVLIEDLGVGCATRIHVGHYRRIEIEPGTTMRRL